MTSIGTNENLSHKIDPGQCIEHSIDVGCADANMRTRDCAAYTQHVIDYAQSTGAIYGSRTGHRIVFTMYGVLYNVESTDDRTMLVPKSVERN